MLDRAFWRWACVVAALILAVVWLLTVTGSGFTGPAWTGPAAVLALAIAVALP